MDAVLQGAKQQENLVTWQNLDQEAPREKSSEPPKKLRKQRSETKEEFEAKYMDKNKQYEPLISKDEDDDSDEGFVHQHIDSDRGNEEINFELTKFDAEELRAQEDYKEYEESYRQQ